MLHYFTLKKKLVKVFNNGEYLLFREDFFLYDKTLYTLKQYRFEILFVV